MPTMPRKSEPQPRRVEIPRGDLFNHLADMAAEMRTLAQTAEAEMLASMFDLAHREAMRQAKYSLGGCA